MYLFGVLFIYLEFYSFLFSHSFLYSYIYLFSIYSVQLDLNYGFKNNFFENSTNPNQSPNHHHGHHHHLYHQTTTTAVRDTFCSYGVMELCTKGLGGAMSVLKSRGVNLSCVRTLCVVAEERPRIHLTTSFAKLFSSLGLSARAVSTSFGCKVPSGV